MPCYGQEIQLLFGDEAAAELRHEPLLAHDTHIQHD
jgi:hypothetical protein